MKKMAMQIALLFLTLVFLLYAMAVSSASEKTAAAAPKDSPFPQTEKLQEHQQKKIQSSLQTLEGEAKDQPRKRERLKQELTQGIGIDRNKKSIRLSIPSAPRQRDGWSCGLHSAARLLSYHKHTVTYEQLMQQRRLLTLRLDSDKGPYTLPFAMQRILRQHHPDSWWMTKVDFEVIKNLLRQGKPVAALIALPGSTYSVKIAGIKIKAPATHWIVISGFDDEIRTIYYHDPLKEDEQQSGYDDFLKVWATELTDFTGGEFNPLLLAYGFVASQTIAFCN